MEGHGREPIGTDVDVSRTVGWFTSVYPVLLHSIEDDPADQLIAVKEHLHRVPNKGVGYGILKYLAGKDFDFEQPQVSFNYLGDFGEDPSVPGENAQFRYGSEYQGRRVNDKFEREVYLQFSGLVVRGRLELSVAYSKDLFTLSTIEELLKSCKRYLDDLLDAVSRMHSRVLTPVDLTYSGLSLDQVRSLDENQNLEDVYGLSPLQEGLYYHWLGNRESRAYFMQANYRVEGRLNLELIEESYAEIVKRHRVLRTYFIQHLADVPLQVVEKRASPEFHVVDLREPSEEEVFSFREKDRHRGFNLNNGSQMRLTLLRLDENRYEFIWSHHHILMDGWCGSLLIKEFFEIYYRLVSKGSLPEVIVPLYSDYIKWLETIDQAAALAYWRNYLKDYPGIPGLPGKNRPGNSKLYKGLRKVFYLDDQVRSGLRQLCAESAITESTFMEMVWGLLLACYGDSNDAVFGAVVSGRPAGLDGVENIIGLFSNTIPVRVRYQEHETARSLLKKMQKEAIAGTTHHYMQLAEVQLESDLGMGLFDTLMVSENFPVHQTIREGVAEASGEQPLSFISSEVFEQTNYDFTITLQPGERFEVRFDCNGNLYDGDQIERVKEHFLNLVGMVVASPDVRLSALEFVSKEERAELLQGFNDTAVVRVGGRTLIDLLESSVRQYGTEPALYCAGKTVSYAELWDRSDRLASYLLQEFGVDREQLVGLLARRGIDAVVGMLGILKSGCAYVPIDPSYPRDRKKYLIEDTGVEVLLTESSELLELDYYSGQVIALDIQLETLPVGDLPEDAEGRLHGI